MKQIAIIGGGASGILAAIHILRATKGSVVLSIYDPAQELGAGLAYGTTAQEHILNVPADKMSCDERDPLSFVNWLKAKYPKVFNDKHYPFVSRQFFKEYLQNQLKKETDKVTVQWIQEKVERVIEAPENHWQIDTQGARTLYDVCVIATGYCPDTLVPRGVSENAKNVIVDPYHMNVDISELQDVAIIGTGLTAVDIWRSLREKNYRGKVHFLSRRGLFPRTFSITKETTTPIELNAHESPLSLLKKLRWLQKREGCDAASLVTQLRPMVPTIWKSWSAREKKQFLTHARPYWDSIRHRLPDSVYAELQTELKEKKSYVHKARGLSLSDEGTRSRLEFSGHTAIAIDKVFIATGARMELHPFDIAASVLSTCPFSLGFETQKKNLYLVGPVSRPTYWEVSAVPEIRIQAQSVAEAIASAL